MYSFSCMPWAISRAFTKVASAKTKTHPNQHTTNSKQLFHQEKDAWEILLNSAHTIAVATATFRLSDVGRPRG